MNLKWRHSYKTVKFNTADGDLSKGQYAKHPVSGWYVRRHPKNNFQFLHVWELDPALDTEEVAHIPGQYAYYDEFIDPVNKRIIRLPSTSQAYSALAIKNASPLSKDLTNNEITQIKKDDKNWKDIPVPTDVKVRKQTGGGIQWQ